MVQYFYSNASTFISTSAKTGIAPNVAALDAVGKSSWKVIISSPFFKPKDKYAQVKETDPFVKAIVFL